MLKQGSCRIARLFVCVLVFASHGYGEVALTTTTVTPATASIPAGSAITFTAAVQSGSGPITQELSSRVRHALSVARTWLSSVVRSLPKMEPRR